MISSSVVEPLGPSVEQAPGSSVEQAPGSSIDQPPQSTGGGGSEISPYFAPNPALSEASARLVYSFHLNSYY